MRIPNWTLLLLTIMGAALFALTPIAARAQGDDPLKRNVALQPTDVLKGNYCVAFDAATFNDPGRPAQLTLLPDREKGGTDSSQPVKIERAYLYWSGREKAPKNGPAPAGDNTVVVTMDEVTQEITATRRYVVDSRGNSRYHWFAYQYELPVTSAGSAGQTVALPRNSMLPVSILVDNTLSVAEPHGVGIVLVYEDPKAPQNCPYQQIDLFFGDDVFFQNWELEYTDTSKRKGHTATRCVDIPTAKEETEVDIQMFVGDADTGRINNIWYASGSGTPPDDLVNDGMFSTLLKDRLKSLKDLENARFDNYDTLGDSEVHLPVKPGDQWACVQLESPAPERPGDPKGVSANWLSLAIRTPLVSIRIAPTTTVTASGATQQFTVDVDSPLEIAAISVETTVVPPVGVDGTLSSNCREIRPDSPQCTISLSSNVSRTYTVGARATITFAAGADDAVSVVETDGTGANSTAAQAIFITPGANMAVEKRTNGVDVDGEPGPLISVGDPMAWTYDIANVGTQKLSDLEVVDDQLGVIACDPDSIEVEDGLRCTAGGTATLGQYTNIVTATALSELDEAVTVSDRSHYCGMKTGVDWGDAPAPYPTLRTDDGPQHPFVTGLYLGVWVDSEPDGKPSPDAGADDIDSQSNPCANANDEDAVARDSLTLTAGTLAQVRVRATNLTGDVALLVGWIDFNGNGSFETTERASAAVPPGIWNLPILLTFGTFPDVGVTQTFARFRLSRDFSDSLDDPQDKTSVRPTGPAADGEVEDHPVSISGDAFDWGDAPNSYQTTIDSTGPRHKVRPGLYMGEIVDREPDGQPTDKADGDDVNDTSGAGNDEDGLDEQTLVADNLATLTARVTNETDKDAVLYGWIDTDGTDRRFDDQDRRASAAVPAGSVDAPVVLEFGKLSPSKEEKEEIVTFARLRLSTDGAAANPTGPATDGEVEDHQVTILPSKVGPVEFPDWGDAPNSYGTVETSDGPHHGTLAGLTLGRFSDVDKDGRPTENADGDDLDPVTAPNDEDSLVRPSLAFVQETQAVVALRATNPLPESATLYGWIDLDANGIFDGAERRKLTVPPLASDGVYTLTFGIVPKRVVTGTWQTYARFRLSTDPAAGSPLGPARDGEVEDHLVTVHPEYRVTVDALTPKPYVGTLAELSVKITDLNGKPAAGVPFFFRISGVNGLIESRPKSPPRTNADGSYVVVYSYRAATNEKAEDRFSVWVDAAGAVTRQTTDPDAETTIEWQPVRIEARPGGAGIIKTYAIDRQSLEGAETGEAVDGLQVEIHQFERIREGSNTRTVIVTETRTSSMEGIRFATKAGLKPAVTLEKSGNCDLQIVDSENPPIHKILIWADLNRNHLPEAAEPSCVGEIPTGDEPPPFPIFEEPGETELLYLPLILR